MADPISIISLVEGSISLIVQCGSAIKSLNEIAAKYKQAELTLSSMIQEVDVIELAWKRIKDWFESYTNEAGDVELLERLDKSLKCGTNVISALQDNLLDYGSKRLGLMQRSKLNWNENALRDHQYRIRGQVQAMSLLLQVIELPTSKTRSKQLQTAQNKLLKSDESAYSIVPSQRSISSSARDSVFSVESAELIHHRWSFEDELFGARVYKRIYAKNLINSVRHSRVAKAKDGAHTILPNDAISTTADDGLEDGAHTYLTDDAIKTTADDGLEASANGALGATGDDAPGANIEQGLVLISEETSKDSECHGEYSWLDLVAIPGLIEEPLQTWTHPKTGHLWLRDSLPYKLISARIFTFNYPSYLLLTDDEANIKIYVEKLLSDLKTVGAGKNSRKLIFIAHSYGGFLCKQAVVLARDDVRYSDIFRNTLLCCFFGTPDLFDTQSSPSFQLAFDLGDLVDIYLEGLGARTLKGRARRSLLETLKANTGSLPQLTDAFNEVKRRHLSKDPPSMHVIEYYEKDVSMSVGRKVSGTTKSLSSYRLTLRLVQIVTEEMMNIFSLFRRGSHTEMCQFESERDAEYQILVEMTDLWISPPAITQPSKGRRCEARRARELAQDRKPGKPS